MSRDGASDIYTEQTILGVNFCSVCQHEPRSETHKLIMILILKIGV